VRRGERKRKPLFNAGGPCVKGVAGSLRSRLASHIFEICVSGQLLTPRLLSVLR